MRIHNKLLRYTPQRRFDRLLFAFFLCLGCFAGAVTRAQAQSPADPTGPDSTLIEPKVWTDKSDYTPGSTAAISGTSFQPGETVVLVVNHADGTPDTGADHQPWPVVADQAGSFQSQWHVCEDDCVGSTLLITATGQTSGFTAKYLFTDSTGSVVFSQFFQQGVTPTTQETAWNAFRAQLTASHNYTKVTLLGSFDTTGVSTSDPVVVSQIAAALRTGGSGTWVSGGRTWIVNPGCVQSGPGNVELIADGQACSCISRYCARPGIRNLNWGGVNTTSCIPPSQTITVIFEYNDDCLSLVCPPNVVAAADADQCSAVVTFPQPTVVITCSSLPGDLIVNGGFETGAFAPWATSGLGASGCATDWRVGNVGSTTGCSVAGNPFAGSFAAYNSLDGYANNTYRLYQDVTIPSGVTGATLSWIDSMVSSYSGSSRIFSVNLLKTDNTLISTIFSLNVPLSDSDSSWTARSQAITALLQAHQGETVRLEFRVFIPASFTGPAGMGLDSVSLVVTTGGGPVSVSCIPASGATFPVGTTTVNCTATDAAGHTDSCSFTVTVNDTQAPKISTLPTPSTIECPATPSFATPTVTDNCGATPLTFADVTTPGTCANAYSVTRTWMATDASGNIATASQTINVADTTKPTISALPIPSTIECPATPSFATPTVTDDCDASPTLTFVDSSSGTCPVVHVRTWTATDACGNALTASQTISVADTTEPTISAVPGPTTIECPAVPVFAMPTATDACGSATLTFVDSSSGTCPVVHVRTWTATDACGLTSTASQTINVADTTPPVISALPAPSTIECPASPSFATPTATDACGSATLTFVDSSSGTCPVVHVRTWTATDACGHTSTASHTISVADTTPPVISALPAPSTIECPASPSFATPTASDTCGTATLTFVDSSSGTCPVVHVRTWTATDACGLTSTASQTISVADTTPPKILDLAGPTAPLPIGSSATVTVSFSDNCLPVRSVVLNWDGGASDTTLLTPSSPVSTSATFTSAGVYSVGVTVTDGCGNTASQVFEFVVIYDPSAGFVTGGGWINSWAGAYIPNPTLAGKANFGFVSKYKKGMTVPTGETEFQFQVGNLDFHSTTYDWLVISGTRAQYKGSGTINGAGNYGFLLTATDGTPDKFRMKIVDKTTSQVVYDNAPGSDDINASDQQALGGGSIIIHK